MNNHPALTDPRVEETLESVRILATPAPRSALIRPTGNAAAAPDSLTRAAAVIAWAAWVAFALTIALGGTPQRGVGAVSLAAALFGCVAFCGLRAWQTGLVRTFALTGAVATYAYSALSYALVDDAAARFPSSYDSGLLAFYVLALVWLVLFIRDQGVRVSHSVWLDAAALSACASAVSSALLEPALGAHPALGAVGQLLYELGDLTLLAFIAAAWGLTGWRRSRVLSFAAAGAAVLALGDGLFVATGADGAPPMLSVVLWPAGLLLLATVSLCRPVVGEPVLSLWAKIAVPTAAALASLVVVVTTDDALPEVAAAAGLALVVVRLVGNLVENSRLLATVERSAITDPLTGLANRQLLLDRIGQALLRRQRRGGAVAVILLDLDDFKLVNDSVGHQNGDDVLRTVGGRLEQVLRDGDTIARASSPGKTVARLAGDEFVVLLEGLRDAGNAADVTERLLGALREPVVVEDHRLQLDASVGIAITLGEHHYDPTELLRDADTAMYAAKDGGKGSYRFFEGEMHRQVVARTTLTRQLRSAVSGDQLRLLYQPQIDLASGRVIGVEALVRWNHPERGLVSPDLFIPVAEITGMIVAIDDWVLLHACRQLRRWQDHGLDLGVAVNVSGRSLSESGLADRVEATLLATGAQAERLEIEITETLAVEDDEQTTTTLQRLRALGVTVAIDDFGMGHSALSRLRTFPVDRLKIDRSFITSLRDGGAEHGSIPAAMIAMARSLDLHVVAEGIETTEHLQALRSLGCDTGQGYLFSRPIPAGEIESLMRRSLCAPAEPAAADPVGTPAQERLVHSLLAELQRLTGLDSTYLTAIDEQAGFQRILSSRNTGSLEIPEDLTVPWVDTVCRRAIAQEVVYTDDVPNVFGDSPAARELGLQTYTGVPVRDESGHLTGTLCGASTRRVPLGQTTLRVMESFAGLIAQARDGG